MLRIQGPFSEEQFQHETTGEWWRVSLHPGEHYRGLCMCQKVKNGHFSRVCHARLRDREGNHPKDIEPQS